MDNIIQFAASTSGLMLIKDINSVYICTSNNLAALVGWNSAQQAVNKTDHNLPCGAAEYANDFIKLDQLIISGARKNLITVDVQPYVNGWEILLLERAPIYNLKNKVIGVATTAIDAKNLNFFNNHLLLNEHFLGKNRQASYIINDELFDSSLTEQQKLCLFLLCRNKNIMQIARLLRLTREEIQKIITELKLLLDCTSESQLVEKAYTIGFHYYLPSNKALDFFENLLLFEQSKTTKQLSPKEINCIQFLAQGKTAKQIARQSNLSQRTIEAYLDSARVKLNCSNRTELVAKTIRLGIIN